MCQLSLSHTHCKYRSKLYCHFRQQNGCIATSEIKIKINSRNVWFPNVITSNGDNINDRFFPKASSNSFRQVNFLSIYDRWGEKIFHQENFPANDPTQGWEGKFNNEYCIPRSLRLRTRDRME
ncbi:MAG: gliding motility-associated C-terminal domain-containing protein [Saprospiraceae bacterium]|nr:gliding motility-associated C-terminal domain-containing protein [Saprospiraceae bacterium]